MAINEHLKFDKSSSSSWKLLSTILGLITLSALNVILIITFKLHPFKAFIVSWEFKITTMFRYYTILPKTKKFDCVGRGDLTSLFF